ncbi:coiled-coil domain-containing protein [Methylobacterium platani]|uniref:DUF1640 domain-containing protein n=2 Tax=Methylobacterium platani TaxID=427683 RepID=A0A179SB30_9HYPH|nr:coiled-coil domain-containing protein [Methylobacterium platani]KMO21807.1 hypothetical protein SQ03_02275 [Methylobacterium platani JCM 14648]OAS24993.1 hypothetical protein A5481_11850 [Methylobacterium platani]
MTAVAFDTCAMVRRLEASGLSEDQAEAITGALKDGRESDLASLATKVDLRETEVALRTDLREAATALQTDLRKTEVALRTDLRETQAALQTDLRKTEVALRTDLRGSEAALQADLRETEGRLDAKITDLSQKVTDLSHRMDLGLAAGRADMKLLEQRMTVKLGALVAAGIGIMVAAFRYMPPAGH